MISGRIDPLTRLVLELSKLPGIGEKTATRLAHFVLAQDRTYASSLASALVDAKQKIGLCPRCFQFADVTAPAEFTAASESSSTDRACEICEDPARDNGQICVVERPSDIAPIERSGAYRGRYHVLHGLLSPMDGVGPENIRARELLSRLNVFERGAKEIIFALNPSLESDATALFLSRLIRPSGIKVTRVAYGLPMGGAIEFSDRLTLGKAMENRTEVAES